MNYKSPLAQARGLGSAKSGTGHWWMQRVTAAALLPLTYWMIAFLDSALNASYQQTLAWLASPVNSVGLIAWILAVFYHAALGMRVVIEDYVAAEGRKIILVWLVNLVFLLLALAALIAIFRILFTG